MAIWGSSYPKIKTSGNYEIELPYAKILKDEPDFDSIMHENVLTGSRVRVRTKYHWIFEVQINLYKYPSPAYSYNLLNTYLNDLVSLWRHRDWEPVCDVNGDEVQFWFKEIVPIFLTDVNFEDALILKFISMNWVDLSKERHGVIHDDETDAHISDDETGGGIILD
jgi:hypothetical protein